MHRATPHLPTIDRVTALTSSTSTSTTLSSHTISATLHLPISSLVVDRVTALDSSMALLQQQQTTNHR
jgi:hypothetical protein